MRNYTLTTLFVILASYTLKAQRFVEVSDARGMTYMYPGNDYQEVGAGVTIIDVNNDGWEDVFQAGGIFPSKLWLNKGGFFEDTSIAYGLNLIDSLYVQGAVAGDYDNDGFEDLFIANYGIPEHTGDNRTPVLLRNEKGKRFVPVLQQDFSLKGNYPGAAWGDLDADGYIDLYVLNYVLDMQNGRDKKGGQLSYIPTCLPNRFYRNQKGKHFVECAEELGLADDGCGLACSFTDFDNDNDVDLILLNDFGKWNGKGNHFYVNENGTLAERTNEFHLEAAYYGMGVGTGDIENDGDFDYYFTNIGRNQLLRNDGTVFTDIADEQQVDLTWLAPQAHGVSWSGLFLDVDNDTDLDLFVAKGHLETIEPVQVKDENQLFLNDGKGNFENVSRTSGINDSLMHRGAAFFDFDHDGDLDIVCGVIKDNRSEFARTDQKIKLFENKSDSKNNWVAIQLVGEGDVNASCIGCSAVLKTQDGLTQIREVDGGSGHSSQSTKWLHYGLGEASDTGEITIQWLGKETTTVGALKANKRYRIYRNGKVEVVR